MTTTAQTGYQKQTETQPIKTARFWVWHKESYVRLALKDGQDLSTHDGGPCDEGYSCESTKWSRDGNTITQEYAEWGRDCDGRHEYHSTRYADIHELEVNAQYATIGDEDSFDEPEDTRRIICRTPNWTREERSQRDYTAESAGY